MVSPIFKVGTRGQAGAPPDICFCPIVKQMKNAFMQDDTRFACSQIVAAIGTVPVFKNDSLIICIEPQMRAGTSVEV
jgi:hypothetical protein